MSPFELPNFLGKKVQRKKDLNFEEAFLDSSRSQQDVLDDERQHPNYLFLLAIIGIATAVLLGRIAFLQLVRGETYREIARGNKLRIQFINAPRGLILDKFGKTIASNIPSFELNVTPSLLPKSEQELDLVLTEISNVLGKDKEEIKGDINKMQVQSQSLTLAQNLQKEQALILISKAKDLPGFEVFNSAIRDYKDAQVFAHLVGYTGKITQQELDAATSNYLFNDYIGKTGLELQYEFYLRGTHGQRQTEIDATGKLKDDLADLPAVPGNNIALNIDYDLQRAVFESITNILKRGRAKKAAAIATDPKTGKVLALVSLPSFDSNNFAQGISLPQYQSLINDQNNPLLNRVVSGTYPPGSTVKPMLAIAALTEGLVTPQTKILDDGVIRIGNFTFYGYERSGLGLMDVYSAIARSSDIYFYTIGGGSPKSSIQGLGPDKLAQWYRKFNLGKVLGIDLPSEKNGLVPDPAWKERVKQEPWYLGNTYHYSIGQGDLLVTPLQVNSWTAAIANNGKIMQPQILNKVVGTNGKVILQTEEKVIAQDFLDPLWVKVAQEGMRQAVTLGSARSLASLPVEIAGKTGTAQFDARNLNLTHAWFTSYAPFSNPEIALTVLVESGGEGSLVAVPIAKEIYTWWAKNRQP